MTEEGIHLVKACASYPSKILFQNRWRKKMGLLASPGSAGKQSLK